MSVHRNGSSCAQRSRLSRDSWASSSGRAPLYRLTRTPVIGLSLPTAVSLLLTSMGLLLARPTAGLMRVATSPGPGGILLRRLALPAIMAPVLLGFVVTRLSAAQGIAGVSIPVAILAATMTGVGLFLLVAIAAPLNLAHDEVEASRTQTRNLVEQAPDGIFVADIDGRYTDVNDAGCRMLGYSREEIIGKTIVDLLPSEDIERLWAVEGAAPRGRHRGCRVEAPPQGRPLHPGGGEREDSSGRPMAGIRSRHQRAQAP